MDEAQAGIKIAMRNINNLRYADDTTIMAESEEELSSLLIKVKVESEKSGLHLKNYDHGILSHNFIAKRWGNMETVTESFFFFFAFKVLWMVCSQEIKTLAPWKKSYNKLIQHIKKQRQHFAHRGTYCQSYGFLSSYVDVWI